MNARQNRSEYYANRAIIAANRNTRPDRNRATLLARRDAEAARAHAARRRAYSVLWYAVVGLLVAIYAPTIIRAIVGSIITLGHVVA